MSMGSFLSSIMTPWTQRPQTPNVGQAIAGAFDDERNARLAQAKLEEEKRKNLATEATTREHVEGTNKYYETQAQTHKEDVEERHQDKLNREFAVAHQAMMKAKTPEERALAQKALATAGAALGYTSHEEPSAAPGAPEEPSSGTTSQSNTTEEKPDDTAHTYTKPPKPNRQTLAGIAAEVANPNAPAGEGAGQFSPPDKEPFLTPMPWESLGAAPGAAGVSVGPPGAASAGGEVPAPEAATAPPEKPKGPSKFVLRDKNGAAVYEWDEPLLHHQNAQSLAATAEALTGGAQTPEEKKAYEMAARAVAPQLDELGPKKALDEVLSIARESLGQYKKRGLGGGGPGSDVPGKDEQKRLFALENVTKNITNSEATRNKLSSLSSQEEAIDQGEALLHGGGFGQTSAMLEWLKGLAGRAPQSEFNALKSQQSVWGQIEQKLNKLEPGAPLSNEIVRQMQEAFAQTRKTLKSFRDEVAAAGEAEVESSIAPFKPKERATQKERVRKALSRESNTPKAGSEDERKKKALEKARALGIE